MESQIDLTLLDARGARRIEALLTAAAGVARQGGDPGAETFCVELAAMLAGYASHRAAKDGEPEPAPLRLDSTGAISTSGLTGVDAACGAKFLLMSGEKFIDEGHERLGLFLGEMAIELGKIAQQKAPSGNSNLTIQ